MISKETYDKLQEYKEIGLSILKSSEKLNLSYKTAYTWWNKSDEEFTSFQKQHEFILDNYRQYLIEQIKICPQINNSLLLKRLKLEFSDFSIPPATFYRYIKKLREQTGLLKPRRAGVIRDEVNPGYEGQVDYGQYTMKSMYGNNIRVYFFVMVLSYSRMKFAYFSPTPFNVFETIKAHNFAFKYFGGRPQMLVYDQDKIMVISENVVDIIFVKEFEAYIKETGFSIYLCRGYDPQTKGRVEKAVDSIKHDFLDGRIYCGIDKLNMECLEWLDGLGNDQINMYTKKAPREMFKSEYGKLIKVYEKKNTDIVVLTPCNTAVKYMNNTYKLPEESITDDSRVRVERHDDILLFYHALTNDLICKHKIPDGTGNVVSMPINVKTISIEAEMHLHYKDDEIAIKFLELMRKQKSRYVYPQCDRLRRMQKYYTDEEIHIGMVHCVNINVCTMMELSAYLLYRYGEERARKYLSKSSYKHYLERSLKIREESEINGRHS